MNVPPCAVQFIMCYNADNKAYEFLVGTHERSKNGKEKKDKHISCIIN